MEAYPIRSTAPRLRGALRIFVVAAFFSAFARGDVLVAPVISGEPISPDFTVKADRHEVPVYPAKISGLSAEERVPFDLVHFTNVTRTSFASFDLKGRAQVAVTCPMAVRSAKLLPSSSGVVLGISGKRITFAVSKPCQLVLEVNGDWIHSLQLFVDPPETNIPDPRTPGILYYGPGRHEVERMTIASGQTVYVAAGAVLYCKPASTPGAILDLSGDNITIRGRGIIDGSLCPPETQCLIDANGTNIRVEGVILRDSSHWTFPIRDSDQVKVDDVKILGYRANSDGIDVCNSRHVTISNCYLRTFDDEIVIKSQNIAGTPSSEIEVRHCVIWNEFAHALSLGAELRRDVENVLFADCDIIHDKGREWLLRVYNSDAGHVKNITFENIRIEEARRFASLWIGHNVWTASQEFGHVNDVVFRNIRTARPSVPGPLVDLEGIDAAHAVHDVLFDHVQVQGQPLKPADITANAYVSDVTVKP